MSRKIQFFGALAVFGLAAVLLNIPIAKALPTTPCRTYLNNGGSYFDDYEQQEYANGFLVLHFKLRPSTDDGRPWLAEWFMHNDDCSTTVYPQPGGVLIENFRPGMQFFSLRFSSLTHYDLWDDEQDIKIDCQNCSGDLPQGFYTTISFEGQRDAGLSLMHSGSYPIAAPPADGSTPPPERAKPVLIIPGILGTEFDLNESTLWLDPLKIATDSKDAFLDPLNINYLGQAASPDLVIGPILSSVNYLFGQFHYSDLLLKEFQDRGYTLGQDLFTFSYDWRQDIKQTAAKLQDKINSILQQTGADKVDIVAHSLGGLVAKQYLLNTAPNPPVNKIVFVAVPNLGAPQAAKTLLFGDSFNIPLLSSDEVQKISQNMPSIYELLPSQQYYKLSAGFYADLSKNQSILDYQSSKNFLLGLGKNKDMIDIAESLHSDQFDNFDFSVFPKIQAYNIIGCGVYTTETINKYYSGDQSFLKGLYNPKYRISSVSGDGTVPVVSAAHLNLPAANTFYVKNVQHAQMLSADGARQLIASIVKGSAFAGSANVFSSSSNCAVQGKLISMPSSLELTVADPSGAALNQTNGVITNKVGNDQFVFLPTDNNQQYNVSAKPAPAVIQAPVNITVEDTTTNKINYYDNIKISQQFTLNVLPSSDTASNVDDLGVSQPVQPTYISDSTAVDSTAPLTALQTYAGQNYKNGDTANMQIQERRIMFQSQDSGSGVSVIVYSFDGGNTWQQYSSGYILVPTDAQSILFFATDKAGNMEQTETVNIQWDYGQTVVVPAPSPAPTPAPAPPAALPPPPTTPANPIVPVDPTGPTVPDPSQLTDDSAAPQISDPTSQDPSNQEQNIEADTLSGESIDLPASDSIADKNQPAAQAQPAPIINVTVNIPQGYGRQSETSSQPSQSQDLFYGVYRFIGFVWNLIFF